MMKITPPTLKIVAKNLANHLNTLNTDITYDLLFDFILKSHNYQNTELLSENKMSIAHKITKKLFQLLNQRNYNYKEKIGLQASHKLMAKAYGYNDYHTFLIEQNQSPIDVLMEEFHREEAILYREKNKGYKEDNENWLSLPIIYIFISKPNERAIQLINNISGIKFLNKTENDLFFKSYDEKHKKWPEKIIKEKNNIIKLVNFRLDPSLRIDIETRSKKSSREYRYIYTMNDTNSFIEKIDNIFYSLLPELDTNELNPYQTIDPKAYIINNEYYNVIDLHETITEFPSTEFWN